VQAADSGGGGGAAPAGLLFAHSSSSRTMASSSHLTVEVEEGGHLFFASQVEPCRQSRGVSDFLGGGRPWVVIFSLILCILLLTGI
jgi:hypothetical protein